MQLPNTASGLLQQMFMELFSIIDEELKIWKRKAEQIPDEELRNQALASIASKKFHCQGGGVFAMLAGTEYKRAIRFIVAYQTISDYLDNLCDRSTSLDPKDFRMLHKSMTDALTPGNQVRNYYAFRSEQEDGGYLAELVKTCQHIVGEMEDYEIAKPFCLNLQALYADLQVHKHVKIEERVPRLTEWYRENDEMALGLSWYEFSAATGSTLGIFCLVSYALGGKMTEQLAERIVYCYFPSVQALHILLDYYIDQAEDRIEGDLNFCNYYRDEVELLERLQYFLFMAEDRVTHLPDTNFHRFIPKGLVALYLSDEKVGQLKNGKKHRRLLLQASGATSMFLHYNIRIYYRLLGDK